MSKQEQEPLLQQYTPEHIRNFSVIAHIDHGKSTLCDRLLEYTGTLSTRLKHEQFLDKLQVERERGITVKAQTASMVYPYENTEYLLNLIDTPGHVDFSYEVSRSLYACQSCLLLVDATQGAQAQTVANFYLAFEQDLHIIPVINKVDMASAQPERVAQELQQLFEFAPEDIIYASAKTGQGIEEIFQRLITETPAPQGSRDKPLKSLLFDSWYDDYRGVVSLIAVHDGTISKRDHITLAHRNKDYEVLELGVMLPHQVPVSTLYPGQVGYIICGMKSVQEARVGDTVFHRKSPVEPFPGFKPARPMVFAGIYPISGEDFELLQKAIEKLTLNDASVSVDKTSSTALGLGFKCGFLGLLHMDVFKQRLEQEYNLSVIATAPSVRYKIDLTNEEPQEIESPAEFPDRQHIMAVYEPVIEATIITPNSYLGQVMQLCEEKRGSQKHMHFLSEDRVMVMYELPLNEIATEFYDELKSITSGYASLDYEDAGYQESNLIKMDILINGRPIDALSTIVHEDHAYRIGRNIVSKLKDVVPKQQFQVMLQAAIGAKIIARETLAPLRKDVTAKCYGGDITRKRKLLEKQKEGKKKMKQLGSVDVPQEAFMAILKR